MIIDTVTVGMMIAHQYVNNYQRLMTQTLLTQFCQSLYIGDPDWNFFKKNILQTRMTKPSWEKSSNVGKFSTACGENDLNTVRQLLPQVCLNSREGILGMFLARFRHHRAVVQLLEHESWMRTLREYQRTEEGLDKGDAIYEE